MISIQLRKQLAQVTAKRPKTVLDHILAHGYVTTDELKQLYGYDHAPRAARDVRELGIPLITDRIRGPNGRMIAAYRLPTEAEETIGKASGRRAFTKAFKRLLIARDGEQCAICAGKFAGNILQIDHKIPYEVGGDNTGERTPDEFMLLCPSCNRTKSWTCEHCLNWLTIKEPTTCQTCLFGSPTNYRHIALEERRRLTLDWAGQEVHDYDHVKRAADAVGQSLEQYAKERLARQE